MYRFAQNSYPTQFIQDYYVLSTGLAGKEMDTGDKIYLPPSALDRLARMNVEYPMLFEVTNNTLGNKTHCGVLEFSADEGYCYMPFWMMQNLGIGEKSLVSVKNVSLSKATFVKFRAQSVDFLEVSNPRALLEVALRKFTCLTVGDNICIPHGRKHFYLEVREVQPNGAASIIETDCNVDFEEPVGYKESKYAQYERKAAEESKVENSAPRTLQKARIDDESDEKSNKFTAFAGTAKRIDGKVTASQQQAKAAPEAKPEAKGTGNATPSESKPSSGGPSAPPVPAYQSTIGDKFSKKKSAVAAFGGAARKLSG